MQRYKKIVENLIQNQYFLSLALKGEIFFIPCPKGRNIDFQGYVFLFSLYYLIFP